MRKDKPYAIQLSYEEERRLLRDALDKDSPEKVRNEARSRLLETVMPMLMDRAKSALPQAESMSLDDLFHEGVVAALDAIDRFNLDSDVRLITYLTQTVRLSLSNKLATTDKMVPNPARRRIGKGEAGQPKALNDAVLNEPCQANSPHEALDAKDRARLLEKALYKLDPVQRDIVESIVLGDQTRKAVAERYETSVVWVRSNLQDAMYKLQRMPEIKMLGWIAGWED